MLSVDANILSRQHLARVGATEADTLGNHTVMSGGHIRHSVYSSITNDVWPRVQAHLEGLMVLYRARAGTDRRGRNPVSLHWRCG